MSKASLLRALIESPRTEFLMEAHDGLSARIAEEAGFAGLWASGLAISAALAVRDSNEASWTQILDVLEFMSDATRVPILLDGDTGYGNFNNMRRLVRKLEQRGIAGVCIEDKLFPKTNSFIRGEHQELADVREFCGKIKAAKETQADGDFCVVARTEAFIVGMGLGEALARAEAYRSAGADAILMHSKLADCREIDAFMKEWDGRHPVVIVPTKYYSTPTEHFERLGVSVVIWANQNLRAAVTAMQRTTRQIASDRHLRNVEGDIASVAELFRLCGADELLEAEQRYLPTTGRDVTAIILAAGQGDLGTLTSDTPKALLTVKGRPILSLLADEFRRAGIHGITVVRGFGREHLNQGGFTYLDNERFADTRDLYSLNVARPQIEGDLVVSYGDILIKSYILHDLLADPADISIVVDCEPDCSSTRKRRDLVVTDRPYDRRSDFTASALLSQIIVDLPDNEANGEFIGLWKVSPKGAATLRESLDAMSGRPDFAQLTVTDLLNEIIKVLPISVRFVRGGWIDIDSLDDLQKAGAF
jgi:phosphoenolpyruvate phosphomutase